MNPRIVRIGLGSMLFASAVPRSASAQSDRVAQPSCDSVLRAARVDSVEVTARAYLVRRDGEILPPRVRTLLLESFVEYFKPPKPLQLPVFSPAPTALRMLRPEHLSGDSVSQREPMLYGVYDFSLLRSGVISRVIASVPSMTPAFDASVLAALNAMIADSIAALVTGALDVDAVALELRITTGPSDSRFRVPPATVFRATFPRLKMVDAKVSGVAPLAEYPDDERDDGLDGEVLLHVVIDVSGAAVIPTMEVVHATSPSFALAAARTLARYHFTPAHVGTCPVPQVIEVPFWFSLRP
ncbi:MAG TPA: energy transducer TonB [Gemmatimonadaceae bacterium]|nr:energy transducer TonB [Gemmatimonadaceae bacterium]